MRSRSRLICCCAVVNNWVNAGLSGKASHSGVASKSGQLLAHDPDAVFIEFAMNDAFSDYEPDDIDYNMTQQMSQAYRNTMIDAIHTARPDRVIVLQTMKPELINSFVCPL